MLPWLFVLLGFTETWVYVWFLYWFVLFGCSCVDYLLLWCFWFLLELFVTLSTDFGCLHFEYLRYFVCLMMLAVFIVVLTLWFWFEVVWVLFCWLICFVEFDLFVVGLFKVCFVDYAVRQFCLLCLWCRLVYSVGVWLFCIAALVWMFCFDELCCFVCVLDWWMIWCFRYLQVLKVAILLFRCVWTLRWLCYFYVTLFI